jgi:ABC-type transport system substrate-binding protein
MTTNHHLSPRRHVRRRALAAMVALGLVVAACGSDDGNADEDTASETDTAASETAGGASSESATATSSESAAPSDTGASATDGGSATESSVSAIDPSTITGKLVVAYHIVPQVLDPYKLVQQHAISYQLPFYDTMIRLNPDGTLRPNLATAWEWSADGKQFIMHLRDDVDFHDGSHFDANVAKANWDRLQASEPSGATDMFESVESTEVIDDYTVALNMSRTDATIETFMAERVGMMVSGEALAAGADLDNEEFGSGPFRVTQFIPGDRVIGERWDDYWGDPTDASVRELELVGVLDSQARLNGALNGDYDLTYLTATQAHQAIETSDINLVSEPSTFYMQLNMNRSKSELGNPLVREAFQYALDRQEICDVIYFGLCEISVQPLPEGHWGYNPDYPGDYFAFDPEHAKELLAEAGLPDGFSFEMVIPAGADPYPQMAELIKEQLAKSNIEAIITPIELSQFGQAWLTDHVGDLGMLGGGQRVEPAVLFKNWLSDNLENVGAHTVPGLDDLIKQMGETPDQDARAELSKEVSKIIVDNGLNIVILTPNVTYATSENVQGYQANKHSIYPYVFGVSNPD